jgi:deoxyribodipyrimidine photolyase-related protein
MRNLVLVLGDQLDAHSSVFDQFDPKRDRVWMAEVAGESSKVWSAKVRTAFFLAAMRHFREWMVGQGWRVQYRQLRAVEAVWLDGKSQEASRSGESLGEALGETLAVLRPARVVWVEAGEWNVREEVRGAVEGAGVVLEAREDRHFFATAHDFAEHARGRKQLRLEFFYREMRRRHGVLMEGEQPAGGEWNFDSENRSSFGAGGPPPHRAPRAFDPDALTREVVELVNTRFANHPGTLDAFDWPVTSQQANEALADFVEHRLEQFGQWQDAMWTGEAWLFHSRLSAAMNVKLLSPRTVVAAAENAWRKGRAPLAAVEGFVRQILGWREYVRGVYWHFMPGYVERNALGAGQPLPAFYWSGDTEMVCLREAIGQTLRFGYAHHIQRLMVTGLFALLLGVRPREVHAWYLAVYVDAIEWVELPNTLGMSQYADGGVMASKPYAASGKYIQRMSNYCKGCRYDPGESLGPKACPFTTLYWDFLSRHEKLLSGNLRMGMQIKNLKRMDAAKREQIRLRAEELRARFS